MSGVDEKLMFDRVRQLCLANGMAIDKIAKECNVNQNLVGKFFIEVMQSILTETEKKTNV
jgi:predicted transcriptional regulator